MAKRENKIIDSESASKKIFNVDLDGAISDLRDSMHHFEVKTKKFERFFRGKSFEFDGFREFSFDDDISLVDWKVSLRTNRLFIRRYLEESPLKIYFIIDTSDNMVFGSTEKLKCEFAAEIALGLAHLILRYNNKVGFVLFNEKEIFIPANRGRHQFFKLVDALTSAKNYGGDSRFERVTKFISNQFDSSVTSVIFLSDFIRINKKVKKQFDLISTRYEIMAFVIRDPLDKELPNLRGEFVLEDPRSGEQIIVDPKLARNSYSNYMMQEEDRIKKIFKKAGIDFVELITNKSFVPDVTEFIKGRVRRF
ncbi:MAG: DUF58 domain-containing protein [Nanoarchaeota archaeon]